MMQEKLLINDSKSNNSEVMRNKQVEEMADIIFRSGLSFLTQAENLYNAGYRKQSEVEKLVQDVTRLVQELDELAEEHSDLIVEKDELFDIAEKQKVEIEALKIANEKMYSAIEETKAEVVREIFEELEREINDALQSNYKDLPLIEQSEALWNRVNGKIDCLRGIDGFIDELKEKYTVND